MRSERAWLVRLFALVTALALVLAACGSDDDNGGGGGQQGSGNNENVPSGGELTIGAEQEPDCTAWIKSCGGSSWGFWMMGVTTMPRSFETVTDGDQWKDVYNKDLLTGEPEVEDSNADKPVITYKINDKAVWSDGEPITCDDFAFTWDGIANGTDIYDPTGYQDIEKVDCPSPTEVQTVYKVPYSGWKQLFGGGLGVYPKHILEGKDITKETSNGYKWSGGPWLIDHWTKGVEI